jgi:hypothetical protein
MLQLQILYPGGDGENFILLVTNFLDFPCDALHTYRGADDALDDVRSFSCQK